MKDKIREYIQLIETLGDMVKDSSESANTVYELRSTIETMAMTAGVVEDMLVEEDDHD